MALETVMLKGARVQKLLTALFYFVLAVCGELYIAYEPVKCYRVLCTLALLHPRIQARPKQSDSSPIFGPCRPSVAVLMAGWERNRSPPRQARVRPHRAAFARTGAGGDVLQKTSPLGEGKPAPTLGRSHINDWRNLMSNKKDRAFTVRFTEEQFQHIQEQSERAMMSPSNYIRAAAMRGKVNVILDGKSVARELRAIGNNLNQLTVLANMGQINAVYLEQVQDDLSRLYDAFFSLADKEVRQ